jgi:hypothetical protein
MPPVRKRERTMIHIVEGDLEQGNRRLLESMFEDR